MKKTVRKKSHRMPRGLAIAMGREHDESPHEGKRKVKRGSKKHARHEPHKASRRVARA